MDLSEVEDVTRNMARLSAGLRESVPAGDQWQVSLLNLGTDEQPWNMVEMRFSRVVDGRKFNYSEPISPAMLSGRYQSPEWIGQFTGRKWIEKVTDAIAAERASLSEKWRL